MLPNLKLKQLTFGHDNKFCNYDLRFLNPVEEKDKFKLQFLSIMSYPTGFPVFNGLDSLETLIVGGLPSEGEISFPDFDTNEDFAQTFWSERQQQRSMEVGRTLKTLKNLKNLTIRFPFTLDYDNKKSPFPDNLTSLSLHSIFRHIPCDWGVAALVRLPEELPLTLTKISISGAEFENSMIPEQIILLPDIEELKLDAKIKSFPVSGMPKLRKLFLNRVNEKLNLKHLLCLEELSVQHFSELFPDLTRLSRLKKITLKTESKHVEVPECLSTLKNLESFVLFNWGGEITINRQIKFHELNNLKNIIINCGKINVERNIFDLRDAEIRGNITRDKLPKWLVQDTTWYKRARNLFNFQN